MFNPHLIPLCTHSLPPALHLRRKVTRTAVEEPLVESGGWSLLPLRLVLGNPQPPRNLRSEFVQETAYWNFFFTKGAGKSRCLVFLLENLTAVQCLWNNQSNYPPKVCQWGDWGPHMGHNVDNRQCYS